MLLKVVAFTLPLCLDSFLLAAALGLARPSLRQRFRLSVLFAVFEGGMPLIGLALGSLISGSLGRRSGWVAVVVLIGFGLYTVLASHQEDERSRQLLGARGLTMVGLGLGISIDGLALGFSYGVVHLPPVLVTVVIIVQALIITQLGFSLGRLLPEHYRDLGEKLAGWALVAIGVVLLAGIR